MFVCAFIYTDKKKNRTSVLNWHFETIIRMYTYTSLSSVSDENQFYLLN